MKDKTFGESSASPRAAGFLLSQTLVLNIPHHTLGFTLFPEQGRRVCGVCAPAYLSLFFSCARMRCWAQTLSSLPLFSSPRSLLVLILLRGESCVCICLCCRTKETHCVLRVGFWLNKSELSVVQQGSGGAGHSSNLGAAPGLLHPSLLPGSLQVKWHFASGAGEVCERDPAGICWVLPLLLPSAAMILMWVNALFNSAGVGKPRRLLGSAA